MAEEWATAANTLEADVRLESTSWHHLADAEVRAAAALTEVEARSPGLPVLDELVAARQRVAKAIRLHAFTLGLDLRGSDALELMGKLRELQPIQRLTVVCSQQEPVFSLHWFFFALTSLVGVIVLVAAWLAVPEFRALATLMAMAGWVWFLVTWTGRGRRRRSAMVQVAGKAIRFPWHSSFRTLRSISWERTASGAFLFFGYEKQAELLEFDDVPDELLQLLSAAGVPINEDHITHRT